MNPKTHIEGLVVVLLTVGYTALTVVSLMKWNEATSGALIMGYALFAQSTVRKFFYMKEQDRVATNGNADVKGIEG